MTTKLRPSQCLFCARHAFPEPGQTRQTCTAFPGGIPDPIWHNQADHRQPYDGDQGQQWTPIAGFEFPEFVLTGGDDGLAE